LPGQPVPWKPPVGPLRERLDAHATATGRTRNELITAAVTRFLDAAGAEPPMSAEAATAETLGTAEPHARWAIVYPSDAGSPGAWDWVVCGYQAQAERVAPRIGGEVWARTPARGWRPVQPETTGEAGQ
jgi:hypothetical protein